MATELQKRIITSIVLLITLALMFQYTYLLLSVLIILSVLSWFEFKVLVYKIFIKKTLINIFIKFFLSIMGLIYLSFFSFWMFIAFSNFEDKILFSFTLSLCIASDLGGILFGKIFKGKKLTKISPNKTISGLIGSYIMSIIFMLIYYFSYIVKYNE